MATPLTDFRPNVAPWVQKCPTVQVDKAVTDAVIDFFRESRLLRATLTAIDAVAGIAEYSLANPSGMQISTIREARFSGVKLDPTSEEQLDLNWKAIISAQVFDSTDGDEDWRTMATDAPGLYFQPAPNVIRLVGIPALDVADALVVSVSLYPTQAVTEIEDWIFNEYYEGIAAGAISRLMAIPNQPWSNLRLVTHYLEMFQQTAGEARSRALRGHSRNDQPILRTTSHR